jgi:hypothetical protein
MVGGVAIGIYEGFGMFYFADSQQELLSWGGSLPVDQVGAITEEIFL